MGSDYFVGGGIDEVPVVDGVGVGEVVVVDFGSALVVFGFVVLEAEDYEGAEAGLVVLAF